LKKKLNVLMIIFTIPLNFNTVIADPIENDFGIVNAWYNGQEATVKDVYLKVGEPAEITVYVYSKIDGNVYIELINPLVTIPYDIISGPSELDEIIQNRDIKSGWSENFTWIIKPNEEWTNGNAPINLFVEFSDKGDDRYVKFTIVNPIILNEQYTGPDLTHTTDQSSNDNSTSQGSPGFGIFAVLLGMALVVIWKQRR